MHNDVEATSLRVNFSPKLGVVIEVPPLQNTGTCE